MEQYQKLIREIREEGTWSENRTAVPTTRLDGAMMRFNHQDGFPATTCKKLAFKSVVGELCAFLRASRSAADFRALGCKVWDQNANDPGTPEKPNAWLSNPFRLGEDDLGPVYGVQWREWPGYKVLPCVGPNDPVEEIRRAEAIDAKLRKDGWRPLGHVTQDGKECYVMYKAIDMLGECIRQIIKAPTGRRILFHAWNPAELDAIALPACHLLYQFLPNPVTGELNMIKYIRSNDVGLGTPFNVAEGALLQCIVARLTGYKPGRLTYFIGDAHIYDNQNDYLDELLTKEPFPLPTLKISDRVPTLQQLMDPHDPIGTELGIEAAIEWLKKIEPSDFTLENYQFHTLETPVPPMVT